MNTYSIARRVIATVLLVELVSALCVTGLALLYEKHTHFRAFDILLRGRADSMLGAVQDAEDANDNVMLDGTEVSVPSDDVYEVKDQGGRVLGRSANAGELSKMFKANQANWEIPRSREAGVETATMIPSVFSKLVIENKTYRVIRMQGTRIVDPGDANGGIRRYVTVYYGSSVERVWRAVLKAAGFYAASSLIVLAATGLLMLWLLDRGLAPLRDLASVATKVTATSWNFSPSDDARRTKELAPLVNALESALRGLEVSFGQQRRFIGDAAHELKTSVAIVKSSLQLLSLRQRSNKEYKAGLDRCLFDCERMEAVVAQMLTLARIEENQAEREGGAKTDAGQCVRKVVERLEAMAETKGVGFAMRDEADLSVDIDPAEFELLCENLLINALQHSFTQGTITISIEDRDNAAQLRIADNGEGIDPRDLPRIFDRFSRGDPSRSRKTGGSGLGLAICKAITDKYKASIEIKSRAGEGTIVLVTFPLKVGDSTASRLVNL
ncbi:MAG TPA: HAMP domain-containing sensor histidine kinase [Terracidiphilus sp.]